MAATMLNVYDLNRRKTAVLQNAYSIPETKELNQIYHLDFSLPATDEKAKYIQAFHYVRYGEDGELYRIISAKQSKSNTSTLTVSCEHVIATLADDLIFGVFQYGGGTIETRDVITALLAKQRTRNWVLGECDFSRRFEYLWEQENILNALYSIPKEFTKAYKWTFDTTVYPWVLSLKAIDETIHPEYYIRAKSNLLGSEAQQDFSGICTRIYPLGYGEGINQLGIKEINGNKSYLEAPADVIARYGVKEKVLVDRRYENAESLKAYGQTMLDALSVPGLSRSFSVVDLYPLTGAEIDNAQPGQIAKLTEDGTITYITKTTRILDQPGTLQIDLSTKATDIASSIADLADRVRIESVYAQGATQLYQHSKDANATPSKGMVMSLYFPEEMRQINKVLLRLKLNKFRSYSKTTSSNGGFSKTYTVAEKSQEITSQTNTEDSSVTVRQSSIDITSQTNTEDSSVTVSSQEKIATTDMTADTDQTLTTTQGGGGTGSTSTQESTLNGNVTTGAVWESGGEVVSAYTGYAQFTEDFYDSWEVDKSSWSAVTDPPEPYSGGDGHYHEFYRPFHHKHLLNNIWAALELNKLSHNHNINLSNVGSHSHTFSIGPHSHQLKISHQHKVTIPSQTIKVPCPKHKHNITIPSQTIKVPCPKHRHNITIPGHSHTITIEPHTHDITPGIFESGEPTAFDIYVGNTKKATVNATSYDGDIATWLLTADKQIPRGQWIDIEIRPNDLAYVQSSVFVQGFVQSRGGGNY